MVSSQGLEPRLKGPKPFVLPLDDKEMETRRNTKNARKEFGGLIQLYHNHIVLKMPIFRHFPAILGVLWQNMNMESSGT